MKKLFELFIVFFKIGTFTVGGGYSMIPLIENEVVDKRKWISKDEFVDAVALGNSAPGPIAVDISVFVGYKVAGIPGSIAAVLGAILTAFVLIILVAVYLSGFKDNAIVERVFKGIRPAVVALIAVPVIRMGKNAKINKKTIFIPILTVIVVVFLKINPIYTIIVSAIGGILYGVFFKGDK